MQLKLSLRKGNIIKSYIILLCNVNALIWNYRLKIYFLFTLSFCQDFIIIASLPKPRTMATTRPTKSNRNYYHYVDKHSTIVDVMKQ